MFFAKLFANLVEQVCVYHEAGERSRLINIFANMHLSGLSSQTLPLWAWRRTISTDVTSCSKDFYIDSNNHLYGLAPFLPQLYPNLHVIHIVRDPRDYVRSHLNWARHRPKSFVANYLTPFWQPSAFLLGEMNLAEWIRATQIERFAWIWNFKNRFIEQLEETKTPYLRVHFEDFFNGPHPSEHLNSMLSFIGLPKVSNVDEQFQRSVNPARKRSLPTWKKWTSEQCQNLQALCGKTMGRYGYGKEASWIEKIASQ